MTNLRCETFTPASPINLLVLVGVCAAGKTSVSQLLNQAGIAAHPVAQEHSRVPHLYRRSGGWVVILAASWEAVHRRRQLGWNPAFYREEWDRIGQARREAALIVHTDWLDAAEVAARITAWFDRRVGFDQLWPRCGVKDPEEQSRVRARFRP